MEDNAVSYMYEAEETEKYIYVKVIEFKRHWVLWNPWNLSSKNYQQTKNSSELAEGKETKDKIIGIGTWTKLRSRKPKKKKKLKWKQIINMKLQRRKEHSTDEKQNVFSIATFFFIDKT